MQTRQLDESLHVSGQVSCEMLPDLAALGFRAIICNRPDGEGGAE
ncbi:MAG: sulfur transferase domain-containing protein, partial [Perlucidibaca sp.]